MPDSGTVLIHGIYSSGSVWNPLRGQIEADPELSKSFDVCLFTYDSPRWQWKITRRIPNLDVLAEDLATFIEVECERYSRLAIITHSQGGLILQRYLAKMTSDGRGTELAKIRRIVHLACPNNGSEILLSIRRFMLFGQNSQERDLRPIAEAVVTAQRKVLNNVVAARNLSSHSCPIPYFSYAGTSDGVVTPASAMGVFPRGGALPGDHSSIIEIDSSKHRTYTTLRKHLILTLTEKIPSPVALGAERMKPILQLTTTTINGEIEIIEKADIFDTETANMWIEKNGRGSVDDGEAGIDQIAASEEKSYE